MYSTAQIYDNCTDAFYTHIYAYGYMHIRVWLYAYAYGYTHILILFVIQDENFSLCFIVVKKKELLSVKRDEPTTQTLTHCTKLM